MIFFRISCQVCFLTGDIELNIIKLPPDTAPIAKRPHGMGINELDVTPKFKDKFEYNNLMCAPGIVAHTSRQITNVSSQVSYKTLLQHKYIKVCDKRKINS